MSSKIKRRGGMSPTTVVLVLVLLGAVAGASRLVTPPPPGPPVEVKQTNQAAPAASQTVDANRMADMKKMKEREIKKVYKDPAASAPVKDPNSIEVTNDYFRTHKPGDAGLKQVDQEMKKATANYDAYLKRRAEAEAKTKGEKASAVTSQPAISEVPATQPGQPSAK